MQVPIIRTNRNLVVLPREGGRGAHQPELLGMFGHYDLNLGI